MARRPPELLTRDHVARCIVREVKEGRGSPHGGVFLNIHWIKEHIADAGNHIKRKLPSMHHQFKELAGVDITQEPMEVGPTTHYVMGGIKVDSDTQMSNVPGLFAAGECAGGLHGANRLGGNSLSDLVVFGKRAGEYSAKFANEQSGVSVDDDQCNALVAHTVKPFDNAASGSSENPFDLQFQLQELMQEKAGIVRNAADLQSALAEVRALRKRAENAGANDNRDYNPGWHTALDLANLIDVSEMIVLSAIDRRESRGGHFRDDFPDKCQKHGSWNTEVYKSTDGSMQRREEAKTDIRTDLQAIIEENQR